VIGSELKILSPVSSGMTSVGMISNIPINITIAIADVREPDKRNSSFSKTITIPGTQQVNRLFEHIFDVTTELSDFDPNLKTRVEYYVRSEKIFDGDLQLLRINKKGISPNIEISYECSIIGRLAKVFLELGNSLLTDLDFSDLDHPFSVSYLNTANLANNPNGTGVGYVYPWIDYGVTGGNSTNWYLEHMKPAIFEKEYIDRIFSAAGKTYTSTFLTSQYYLNIIIPDVNEGQLKMSASQINSLSFYAGKSATTTYTVSGLTVSGSIGTASVPNFTVAAPLNFNDDITPPFYDGGGNYNAGTYTFTTPVAGSYKMTAQLNFQARVNLPSGATTMSILNGSYTFKCDLYDATSFADVATGSVSVTPNSSGWTDFAVTVSLPPSYILGGQQFYMVLEVDDSNYMATSFGGSPTGSWSVDVRLLSTSWFSGTSGDNSLPMNAGYNVVMNQTIPKNIKQIDFLMSVLKRENLYMELDASDPNNYIIEQREDFYLEDASNTLDWTSKWDYQNETQINPMGELDAREYIFSYKKDGDKFNNIYYNTFGEVYGQEQIRVENDFIKNVKKNELIFAATPLAGNPANNIVAPVLAKESGSGVAPLGCAIRCLYWGGLKSCQPYNLYYPLFGYSVTTSYWYAGHLDDPYNPTIDLLFDNPKMLFYTYPGIVYTTNGLYLRNYQKYIEQITDKNSKLVTMWMYLTPSDISNFSFRKRIWIHDSYYIVNKIMDYNPQETSLCKVEFLRLAFVDDPVAEIIEIWANGESGSGISFGIALPSGNPNYNFSNGDGSVSGNNNQNLGNNSDIIGGSGNFIG
jgi:hypothetical protein